MAATSGLYSRNRFTSLRKQKKLDAAAGAQFNNRIIVTVHQQIMTYLQTPTWINYKKLCSILPKETTINIRTKGQR